MKLDLLDLKVHCIKKLKEHFLKSSQEVSAEFTTLSYELMDIDLAGLIGHLSAGPICYFKNKSNTFEMLGINCAKRFTKIDYQKDILSLSNENDKLIIMGGERFQKSSQISPEWEEFGQHYYFLPQFSFVKIDNKLEFRININKSAYLSQVEQMTLFLQLENTLELTFKRIIPTNIKSVVEIPDKKNWEKLVNKGLQELQEGQLEKVVLSRKTVNFSEKELSPKSIFATMLENSSNNYIFFLNIDNDNSFISMSPEKLFQLEGPQLTTDALAGTRPRSLDKVKDAIFSKELINSKKEIQEHDFVVKNIYEVVEKLSESITIPKTPEVMRLKNIQHLYTPIKANLKSEVNFSDIIGKMHPTAAVGGTPKNHAIDFISKNESYDRGFYAAPVGYISKNSCEFSVAIRSALIKTNTIHIFGGAGIVPGSEAKEEWIETTNKMKNFQLSI